ncbi:hypothetical protein L0F63_006348, partial [Massospora cicadina]
MLCTVVVLNLEVALVPLVDGMDLVIVDLGAAVVGEDSKVMVVLLVDGADLVIVDSDVAVAAEVVVGGVVVDQPSLTTHV